jgi:hypothetical protein
VYGAEIRNIEASRSASLAVATKFHHFIRKRLRS